MTCRSERMASAGSDGSDMTMTRDMHRGWQRYTLPREDTTLGHLVRHHLLPFAHHVSCTMEHPLELGHLQMSVQATPESGQIEADRLMVQACRDAHIELTQFAGALASARAS